MKSDFSKLSDIAEVIDSFHKTPKYSEPGKAMVRCTDVKYGKLNLSKTLKVNDDVFAEFSRRYVPSRGDIIITRVGSYGITAIVDDTDFCMGQNTSVIISKINPRYLYLALNSPIVKNQIEYSVVGSTQKNLSLKAINNLDIPRFDTKTEDLIAKIGGELDDKIELNRQTNQTLEAIAQAIFKSWFVDFEPTRAKIAALEKGQDPERAAMCAISGAVQGCTNVAGAGCAGATKSSHELEQLTPDQLAQLKTTAALFPDALVESELGEIPEGWEHSTLGEHFNIVMGQSPKGDTYNEEGNGMLFFQGRRDFGFRYPSPRVYTTAPKRFAQKGDTLISVRAPVGDRNMANQECCLGRGVASIRHKSGSRSFTYAFIGYIEKNLSDNGSDGTVFNSINKNELSAVNFIAPQPDLLQLFEDKISSIDQKIEVNSIEIDSLENLRDTLLLKLLSGALSPNPQLPAHPEKSDMLETLTTTGAPE